MKLKNEIEIYKLLLIYSCLVLNTVAAKKYNSGSLRSGLSSRTSLSSFSPSGGSSRNGRGLISIATKVGSNNVGLSLPIFNTGSNKQITTSFGNGRTDLHLGSIGYGSPSVNIGLQSLNSNSVISNAKALRDFNTPTRQPAYNPYYNPPAKIPSTTNSVVKTLFKQPYLDIAAKFITAYTKAKKEPNLSGSPMDFANSFPHFNSFNHTADYNHVKDNRGYTNPTIFHHNLFKSQQEYNGYQNQTKQNFDRNQIIFMITLAVFIIIALV